MLFFSFFLFWTWEKNFPAHHARLKTSSLTLCSSNEHHSSVIKSNSHVFFFAVVAASAAAVVVVVAFYPFLSLALVLFSDFFFPPVFFLPFFHIEIEKEISRRSHLISLSSLVLLYTASCSMGPALDNLPQSLAGWDFFIPSAGGCVCLCVCLCVELNYFRHEIQLEVVPFSKVTRQTPRSSRQTGKQRRKSTQRKSQIYLLSPVNRLRRNIENISQNIITSLSLTSIYKSVE